MITQIRNSVFAKVLWGLMGLYFLNISVDTADPDPEIVPEDLSFNDQESIIEIVVEQVLGFEDAIKEYDDHDTEDHNKNSNIKKDLSVYRNFVYNTSHLPFKTNQQIFPDFEVPLTNGFHQIDTPPPKN